MESKYFRPVEFLCKYCLQTIEMDPELIKRLDRAREILGRPIHVLWRYRCEEHNQWVGGVPRSFHCQGKVADLRVFSSGDRMLLMQAVLKAGFGRIGIYREGFIHVDVGKYPANVMWVE